MKPALLPFIFFLFGLFILNSGCMEPPIREPIVSVSDIALSNVSFSAITVNTTVTIFNPNPIGARVSRVTFDVYYLGDTWTYLGHGEQTGFDVKSDGNTSVVVPVNIGTAPAIGAIGSLVRKGSLTVRVNGSAFVDIRVTSFEKQFEQSRVINASDIEGIVPMAAIPGIAIHGTDNLGQLGRILGSVT